MMRSRPLPIYIYIYIANANVCMLGRMCPFPARHTLLYGLTLAGGAVNHANDDNRPVRAIYRERDTLVKIIYIYILILRSAPSLFLCVIYDPNAAAGRMMGSNFYMSLVLAMCPTLYRLARGAVKVNDNNGILYRSTWKAVVLWHTLRRWYVVQALINIDSFLICLFLASISEAIYIYGVSLDIIDNRDLCERNMEKKLSKYLSLSK